MLVQLFLSPEHEAAIDRIKEDAKEQRTALEKLCAKAIADAAGPLPSGRPVYKFKPDAKQKSELSYVAATYGNKSKEYLEAYGTMERAFLKYVEELRQYQEEVRERREEWVVHVRKCFGGLLGDGKLTNKQSIIIGAFEAGVAAITASIKAQQAQREKKVKAALKDIPPLELPECPKVPQGETLDLVQLQRKYAPKKRFS